MQQEYSTHRIVGRQFERPVPVPWETLRIHLAAGGIADYLATVRRVYAVVDLFFQLVKQAIFKLQVVLKINDIVIAGGDSASRTVRCQTLRSGLASNI